MKTILGLLTGVTNFILAKLFNPLFNDVWSTINTSWVFFFSALSLGLFVLSSYLKTALWWIIGVFIAAALVCALTYETTNSLTNIFPDISWYSYQLAQCTLLSLLFAFATIWYDKFGGDGPTREGGNGD